MAVADYGRADPLMRRAGHHPCHDECIAHDRSDDAGTRRDERRESLKYSINGEITTGTGHNFNTHQTAEGLTEGKGRDHSLVMTEYRLERLSDQNADVWEEFNDHSL